MIGKSVGSIVNDKQIQELVTVPASATVTEVQVFTRLDDTQQTWDEARAQVGKDTGAAKFIDAHFERARGNESKEICQHFAHWNSQKGRSARILVRYTL